MRHAAAWMARLHVWCAKRRTATAGWHIERAAIWKRRAGQ